MIVNETQTKSIELEHVGPIEHLSKPRDSKVIELSGQRFGRWVALHYVGDRRWFCRCDCGNERAVPGINLRKGFSRSCGCLQVELFVAKHTTHGRKHTPEWRAWQSMRGRCLKPNHHAWDNYGGRGITICQRWLECFENFYVDMGDRPDGHSLDRIDNDGNYEPSNCRWSTRIQQESNKRSNRFIEWNDRSWTLSELAREFGMLPGTLSDRLEYGWSLERALTTPVRKRMVAS